MEDNCIIKKYPLVGVFNAVIFSNNLSDVKVIPFSDSSTDATKWEITGDYNKLMRLVYDNVPVGALDVLTEIKQAENVMYALKKAHGGDRR
jgi:hypothetical protein